MSKLKIGWAEEKFEFNKPVNLVGQFAERISEYEEKPLCATTLVLKKDEEEAIICSVDLLDVSCVLVSEVKKILKTRNTDIDTEKIIICATHPHTGPGYMGYEENSISIDSGSNVNFRYLIESVLPKGKKYIENTSTEDNNIMSKEEVLNEVSLKIANSIEKAWINKKDSSYSNAFGRAPVGMCRRVKYVDGTAKMWGDTNSEDFLELEGGSDSGIELMYFFDEDKKLTGIAANLACPAQCVQHRMFISPDFWGEVKMLLREHFGKDLFLLTLCSAAGDQCPIDLIRFVTPESDVNDPNIKRETVLKRKADPSMFDISGMKKTGKRIANEIIEIYNEGLCEAPSDTTLVHETKALSLPLRRVTKKEVRLARKEIKKYFKMKDGDVDFNDAANLQVHLGTLKRNNLQKKVKNVEIYSHIIRLDNIAIATNPFELFLDYGNQIKARSKAEQTFVIQLANGYEGYLPTKKAQEGGHYSAFVSSGIIGYEGGNILVEETLKGIDNIFTE